MAVAGTAVVADIAHCAADGLEPADGSARECFVVVVVDGIVRWVVGSLLGSVGDIVVVVGGFVLVRFVVDGDIFRWYLSLASCLVCLCCLIE